MNAQTVLLYGQSLLLSGVAADLAEVPGLQVERARTWEEASHLLAEGMPNVLIFDLTGDCESHVLPLLFKSPGMVMVGLDPEHNQAVLLSGRASQSLTLDQIRHIAAGERRGQGEEKGGKDETAELSVDLNARQGRVPNRHARVHGRHAEPGDARQGL